MNDLLGLSGASGPKPSSSSRTPSDNNTNDNDTASNLSHSSTRSTTPVAIPTGVSAFDHDEMAEIVESHRQRLRRYYAYYDIGKSVIDIDHVIKKYLNMVIGYSYTRSGSTVQLHQDHQDHRDTARLYDTPAEALAAMWHALAERIGPEPVFSNPAAAKALSTKRGKKQAMKEAEAEIYALHQLRKMKPFFAYYGADPSEDDMRRIITQFKDRGEQAMWAYLSKEFGPVKPVKKISNDPRALRAMLNGKGAREIIKLIAFFKYYNVPRSENDCLRIILDYQDKKDGFAPMWDLLEKRYGQFVPGADGGVDMYEDDDEDDVDPRFSAKNAREFEFGKVQRFLIQYNVEKSEQEIDEIIDTYADPIYGGWETMWHDLEEKYGFADHPGAAENRELRWVGGSQRDRLYSFFRDKKAPVTEQKITEMLDAYKHDHRLMWDLLEKKFGPEAPPKDEVYKGSFIIKRKGVLWKRPPTYPFSLRAFPELKDQIKARNKKKFDAAKEKEEDETWRVEQARLKFDTSVASIQQPKKITSWTQADKRNPTVKIGRKHFMTSPHQFTYDVLEEFSAHPPPRHGVAYGSKLKAHSKNECRQSQHYDRQRHHSHHHATSVHQSSASASAAATPNGNDGTRPISNDRLLGIRRSSPVSTVSPTRTNATSVCCWYTPMVIVTCKLIGFDFELFSTPPPVEGYDSKNVHFNDEKLRDEFLDGCERQLVEVLNTYRVGGGGDDTELHRRQIVTSRVARSNNNSVIMTFCIFNTDYDDEEEDEDEYDDDIFDAADAARRSPSFRPPAASSAASLQRRRGRASTNKKRTSSTTKTSYFERVGTAVRSFVKKGGAIPHIRDAYRTFLRGNPQHLTIAFDDNLTVERVDSKKIERRQLLGAAGPYQNLSVGAHTNTTSSSIVYQVPLGQNKVDPNSFATAAHVGGGGVGTGSGGGGGGNGAGAGAGAGGSRSSRYADPYQQSLVPPDGSVGGLGGSTAHPIDAWLSGIASPSSTRGVINGRGGDRGGDDETPADPLMKRVSATLHHRNQLFTDTRLGGTAEQRMRSGSPGEHGARRRRIAPTVLSPVERRGGRGSRGGGGNSHSHAANMSNNNRDADADDEEVARKEELEKDKHHQDRAYSTPATKFNDMMSSTMQTDQSNSLPRHSLARSRSPSVVGSGSFGSPRGGSRFGSSPSPTASPRGSSLNNNRNHNSSSISRGRKGNFLVADASPYSYRENRNIIRNNDLLGRLSPNPVQGRTFGNYSPVRGGGGAGAGSVAPNTLSHGHGGTRTSVAACIPDFDRPSSVGNLSAIEGASGSVGGNDNGGSLLRQDAMTAALRKSRQDAQEKKKQQLLRYTMISTKTARDAFL